MDDLVPMGEAAQKLGISRQKVWRLVKEGCLTSYQSARDMRERLVRLSELEAALTPVPEDPSGLKRAA